MHGVQIWLALPTDREEDAPSFQHHPEATLPAIAPAPGVTGRLLLGERFGARSPVSHPSEPVLVDLELEAGSTVDVPAGGERGVFVIDGELQIDQVGLQMNRLAVLHDACSVRVTALARTRALVLGGPTLGQRFIEWNFVSSAKDRIARASAAWRAQTFPRIPGDDQEFIPLPEPKR
jgi:redox-sensitive bicupin YhaK (pirin superfamily)